MQHVIRRAGTCHRVLQHCLMSTLPAAGQMHTSLHQFTDDECMMRDAGECC